MPVAFFQIPLSVRPKGGGEAELVPPKVLQDRKYTFVIVKDNGEEGIIRIEAPAAVLTEVADDKTCKKLTQKQMNDLRAGYPPPRLKQKYRLRADLQEADEAETEAEPFEMDEKGNPVVDTIQTVRAGFYLIDVSIVESTEK